MAEAGTEAREFWARLSRRSRTSVTVRLRRLDNKKFQVLQCAIAAGVAWWLATDVFDHARPFFAPIAAIVSLGTSYGQRLRRVMEVSLGVAVGVFLGDVIVAQVGTGWWQLSAIVVLAMSAAFLLDGGQLFVTQAAVQSVVVATLLPNPNQAFSRWSDALIGGAVALVAATVVPAAPLRRPREQSAEVLDKVAQLLRAAAQVMRTGDVEPAFALLADARSTDYLIRELQAAADEGLSVVASSPLRVRHRPQLRQMAELVEPLDRALRSTRVLIRRTAIVAYRHQPVPQSYALLCDDLAQAVAVAAEELRNDRMATEARGPLLLVAEGTGTVERHHELNVEVILAQLRSIIADLLLLTGMDQFESTDALPPVRD